MCFCLLFVVIKIIGILVYFGLFFNSLYIFSLFILGIIKFSKIKFGFEVLIFFIV